MEKGMLPPAYLLLALVAMALLHLALPWHRVVAFPWRLAGIPPLVVGLGLNVMEVVFIRKEERMMETAFGREWLVYRARVQRRI